MMLLYSCHLNIVLEILASKIGWEKYMHFNKSDSNYKTITLSADTQLKW